MGERKSPPHDPGKISPTRAKNGPNRARNVPKSVIVPKKLFCADILSAEHTLSEEITLNEVWFQGSPTIDFALPKAKSRKPL